MLLQGAQIETTRHGTGKIRNLCLLCAPIDQREVERKRKIHRSPGDNTAQTTQQGDQQTKKTPTKNGRKSKIVACVLRAHHNDLQRGRVRSAAAQRSSRRPTQRNRTISRRKCTHNHVLQASFATLGPAAMMTTLRRRRAAAQPECSATVQPGVTG